MKATVASFFAIFLLALAPSAHSSYIYDNSVNDQTNRLEASDNLWFGDEVTLAGTDRFMTNFNFQFWATNTVNLTIDVELRLNDGTPFNGYDSPGTLIYGFYGFSLPNTDRSTLNFDAADLDLFDTVSDGGTWIAGNTLTLTVQFHFNGGGGEAGVDLYNPPATGSSYPDYWQYNGTSWELTTNNTFSVVNFGMTIEAIPEPSTISILLLGGLTALGVRRLFVRK